MNETDVYSDAWISCGRWDRPMFTGNYIHHHERWSNAEIINFCLINHYMIAINKSRGNHRSDTQHPLLNYSNHIKTGSVIVTLAQNLRVDGATVLEYTTDNWIQTKRIDGCCVAYRKRLVFLRPLNIENHSLLFNIQLKHKVMDNFIRYVICRLRFTFNPNPNPVFVLETTP